MISLDDAAIRSAVVLCGPAGVHPDCLGRAALVRVDERAGEGGSDLVGALGVAGAMIPPDAVGCIILFSDGVQTQGSADAAAKMLAGSKSAGGRGGGVRSAVRVDVVPLTYRVDREVVVES